MEPRPLLDRFLVVGGSGFLGRHIVKKILDRKGTVSVLDVIQRYHDTPFHGGSICSLPDVLAAILQSGATCIIHTASPPPTSNSPELLRSVNVQGTRTVILAAQQLGVKKLVFTSSSGVVFKGFDLCGVDEGYPLPNPIDHIQEYNRTKAQAETDVITSNGINGLMTCALRPAGIFGPGEQLALNILFQIYQRGQSHIQIGKNQNLFDWTYVENVADAHILAAEKLGSNPEQVAGEVFFITNDDPIPFWDYTNRIHAGFDRFTGQNLTCRRRIVIPQGLAYILAIIAEFFAWLLSRSSTFTRITVSYSCVTRWHSVEKAKRVLGYQPCVKVHDGIERTIEWWGQERGWTYTKGKGGSEVRADSKTGKSGLPNQILTRAPERVDLWD